MLFITLNLSHSSSQACNSLHTLISAHFAIERKKHEYCYAAECLVHNVLKQHWVWWIMVPLVIMGHFLVLHFSPYGLINVKLNCSYCDHEQKENICVDKTRPESLINMGMISI